MRKFYLLLAWSTLLTLFVRPVAAHEGTPVRSVSVRVGPYPLMVHYYNAPRGGGALAFSIEPQDGQAVPQRYTVTAVPGTTVNAVPVNAVLAQDPAHEGGVDGSVSLPVSGQWLLNIEVDGPLGTSYEDVPVLAGPPPAIPEWLGWMIGLMPCFAMGAWLFSELRRSRIWSVEPASV
jgi:hypothetical protein